MNISNRRPSEVHAKLVHCAVLLDIGLAAACLLAFGVWDLVESTHSVWIVFGAIAFGGTVACVLWLRAGTTLDRAEPSAHARSEHEAVVAGVERRVLTHPFAR